MHGGSACVSSTARASRTRRKYSSVPGTRRDSSGLNVRAPLPGQELRRCSKPPSGRAMFRSPAPDHENSSSNRSQPNSARDAKDREIRSYENTKARNLGMVRRAFALAALTLAVVAAQGGRLHAQTGRLESMAAEAKLQGKSSTE